MNFISDIDMEIELPGLDEVIKAEIGIVREDVERLERGFRATCDAIGEVRGEMAAIMARYRTLKARQDELTTKSATERRMLLARKRILFEMEEEIR